MDQRKNYFDKLFKINVPHILEKIFFSLDYKSFKNCLEVSNVWNELLTSEAYKKKGKRTFNEEIGEEMWYATENGNADEVKRLLSGGMVDVNLQKLRVDRGWQTLLGFAVLKGHKEVARLLLDAGADPNKEDYHGWTPLTFAAFNGYTDMVKLLLNGGADLNKANINGFTPLHCAAAFGLTDVVKLLLQAGADPTVTDFIGRTPLNIATARGQKEIADIINNIG